MSSSVKTESHRHPGVHAKGGWLLSLSSTLLEIGFGVFLHHKHARSRLLDFNDCNTHRKSQMSANSIPKEFMNQTHCLSQK